MKISRLIFYCSGICNETRVLVNLRKIIPEVITVTQRCNNVDVDADLAQLLFQTIHLNNAEAMFSLDYYPIIAEVAHTVGIPYISWIIDAPHYTLYSTASYYTENYIFHFDREEAERLIAMGRPNVFHMHLASDPGYFRKNIRNSTPREIINISFMGASYQNEHDYFEKNDSLKEYDRGYFEGVIKAQSIFFGVPFIEKVLSHSEQKLLIDTCNVNWPDTYDIPISIVASNILEKKLSVRERKQLVAELGEQFGITLYSESDAMKQKGVLYKGYADYENEMALIFYYSKVNLNHTLRGIHSGIPLRALDIMACGGFLLSNYQPELEEWFEDGVNLAMYGSIEEMVEKAEWYLEHDELRRQIAVRGYEITCEHFTYEKVIKKMIDIVCGNAENRLL